MKARGGRRAGGSMVDLGRGGEGKELFGGRETRRLFVKEREMTPAHVPSVSPLSASGFT